jgi:hypothetical protein
VQLRKMFATDFRGWTRIKNFFKNVWLSRAEGADSFCGRELGEKFGRRRRLIVHRGCTGNAERQWSVAGGQWLVLAGGFAENHPVRGENALRALRECGGLGVPSASLGAGSSTSWPLRFRGAATMLRMTDRVSVRPGLALGLAYRS